MLALFRLFLGFYLLYLEKNEKLAAFDLDGTILINDSFKNVN